MDIEDIVSELSDTAEVLTHRIQKLEDDNVKRSEERLPLEFFAGKLTMLIENQLELEHRIKTTVKKLEAISERVTAAEVSAMEQVSTCDQDHQYACQLSREIDEIKNDIRDMVEVVHHGAETCEDHSAMISRHDEFLKYHDAEMETLQRHVQTVSDENTALAKDLRALEVRMEAAERPWYRKLLDKYELHSGTRRTRAGPPARNIVNEGFEGRC